MLVELISTGPLHPSKRRGTLGITQQTKIKDRQYFKSITDTPNVNCTVNEIIQTLVFFYFIQITLNIEFLLLNELTHEEIQKHLHQRKGSFNEGQPCRRS